MANICENTMNIYTQDEKNLEYFLDYIKELDKDCFEVTYQSDDSVTVEFQSRWTFPEGAMDKMYECIPNKDDDFNITCLSVEWGQLYCQFTTCDKNGWTYQG